MPNLTSILGDLAGQAIANKFAGGNTQQQQQKQPKSGSGLNLSSTLTTITSAISSSSLGGNKSDKYKDYSAAAVDQSSYNPPPSAYYQQQPSQPQQGSQSNMSSGYPPYGGGGGSAYGGGGYGNTGNYGGGPPPPQQQNTGAGGYGSPYPGYPPQQGGYSGYALPQPPSQQHGSSSSNIGFNLDQGGGGGYGQQPAYPSQQSNAPYPTSGGGAGYPPSSGGGGYQPNLGGGGYGGAGNYPPSSSPYPSGGGGSVYPTHALDSVQQHYGGGIGGGGYGSGGYQSGGGGYGSGANYSAPHLLHHQQQQGPRMAHSNPTIKPNPNFNANHSAEMLRNAMKGLGCNKDKVIQALCTNNNWQRQQVANAFKVMYGKDLISELKGELSGDFENLIVALMESPVKYDAQQLHKAMAGLGTKEHVLIEIMTTRTNAQIQELKATYKQLYGKDLEHDLTSETSGHFKRLLVSLCCGARDESYNVDPLKANQDARGLYRAGEQRLGTDESKFNSILASQNANQLNLVFQEYKTISGGHSIEDAINAEFSSDIRDGLLAVVKSIRNKAQYFAELIHNSMKGLGTRDNDLIRLIVTRSEVDLGDIRNVYPQLYNQTLEKAIAGDCSGAYKDGLICLVKGNL